MPGAFFPHHLTTSNESWTSTSTHLVVVFPTTLKIIPAVSGSKSSTWWSLTIPSCQIRITGTTKVHRTSTVLATMEAKGIGNPMVALAKATAISPTIKAMTKIGHTTTTRRQVKDINNNTANTKVTRSLITNIVNHQIIKALITNTISKRTTKALTTNTNRIKVNISRLLPIIIANNPTIILKIQVMTITLKAIIVVIHPTHL